MQGNIVQKQTKNIIALRDAIKYEFPTSVHVRHVSKSMKFDEPNRRGRFYSQRTFSLKIFKLKIVEKANQVKETLLRRNNQRQGLKTIGCQRCDPS